MLPMLSLSYSNSWKMGFHLPMLCHAVWNHDKYMLPVLFYAIWSHENKENPCYPMMFEIMRKCCTILPMLFRAIQNHEKVLSHAFHMCANSCSANEAWKIFPCFCRAWETKGSIKSIGNHAWISHAFYTRVKMTTNTRIVIYFLVVSAVAVSCWTITTSLKL